MIGRDEVNRSIEESLPQVFAIFAAANWRSALKERCPLGDFFGSQMQIVRAGLDTHLETLQTCGAQLGKRCAGGEMDDVQAELKFAAQGQQHSNR